MGQCVGHLSLGQIAFGPSFAGDALRAAEFFRILPVHAAYAQWMRSFLHHRLCPCFCRILWYFTRCCRAEMLTHSKSTGAFVISVCLETAGGDYRQTTITTH